MSQKGLEGYWKFRCNVLAQLHKLSQSVKSGGAADSEKIEALEKAINELSAEVGDVDNLSTTAKTIVAAINEVYQAIGTGGTASVVTVTEMGGAGNYIQRYEIKQGGVSVGTINIPKELVSKAVKSAMLADDINVSLAKANTAYQKPTNGIPTGDIAKGAITADKIADGVIPDVSGFATADRVSTLAENLTNLEQDVEDKDRAIWGELGLYLKNATQEITTQAAFDAFIEPNKVKYATFRGGSGYGNWDTSGVISGDGIVMSIGASYSGFGVQIVYDDESNYCAMRTMDDRAWSKWSKFAFGAELATKYTLPEGGIPTADIADGAITADKIADGYYPDMLVGYADNLTGHGESIDAMFIYRPTADSLSVESGVATIKRIKGNSIVWNQKINNVLDQTGENGWLIRNGAENISFNNTTIKINFASANDPNPCIVQKVNIIAGHKYYIRMATDATGVSSSGTYGSFSFGNSIYFADRIDLFWWEAGQTYSFGGIYTPTENRIYVGMVTYSATLDIGDYITISDFQLFDLTQIFGAGKEPSTEEEFKALYPDTYYEYAKGSIQNLSCYGIETVGFNQWDEQWEIGYISTIDGLEADSSTCIRAANFIECLPNIEYYISHKALSAYIIFYNSNKEYVGHIDWAETFTTPNDCSFIRFFIEYGTNISTYGNDICINLSHTGYRNGEYEPYNKEVFSLPISEITNGQPLRSVGDVFDEINATTYIQRIGQRAFADGDAEDATVLTDGTTTNYPLAEKIVTPIDISFDLNYYVDDFGTEKALLDDGSPQFRADIVYLFNAVDRIRSSVNWGDIKDALNDKIDIDTLNKALSMETITAVALSPNTYYNGFGKNIGDYFGGIKIETDANIYTATVDVKGGEVYRLKGKGNADGYRGYIIVDSSNIITRIITEETYDAEITIGANECKLYCTLLDYNSATDGVWKITSGSLVDIVSSIGKKVDLPLNDVKLVCFGDSITQFTDSYGYSWTNYLNNNEGATVYNVAIGGSQIRQRMATSDSPLSSNQAYAALDIYSLVKAACEQNFIYQDAAVSYLIGNGENDYSRIISTLKQIDFNSIDMVIIFGGTNDWLNSPDYWGDFETSTDAMLTSGAIRLIIQNLCSTYPHLQVMFITPIVRWISSSLAGRTTENWGDNYKVNDTTLKEFVSKIKTLIKNEHLPICDLYTNLGWNQYNFYNFFYDNDGTHPYNGFKEIAGKIASFIKSHIWH